MKSSMQSVHKSGEDMRIPLCIVHVFTSLFHLQYLIISSMQIQKHREGLGNLVMCSDVRRIRRKTHGSHCLIHNWPVHQTRNKARQCSLLAYMQLINHLIYMSFLYPKELEYLGLHTYKTTCICMLHEGCSEMIQPMSPYRAARYTPLPHHSILTTYCHTDTMLTSSLFPWCAAYSLVLCLYGKVKFHKGRVKIQIMGKPVFSYELCPEEVWHGDFTAGVKCAWNVITADKCSFFHS